MGTELAARGVSTRLPLWSASALEDAPEVVAQIHRDYVAAGAEVITTNTFRTQRRTAGAKWRRLTSLACELAREAAGDARVAGSIAPLADCYEPERSNPAHWHEHEAMAALLATRCDLLLCETFPHPGEALAAARAALATGKETWVALTAGPDASLMSPETMVETMHRLVEEGVHACLVNCTPAPSTLAYLRAMEAVGVQFGAYANAGEVDDAIGWRSDPSVGAAKYRAHAQTWINAGARIIGGCCGTGVKHVEALAQVQ